MTINLYNVKRAQFDERTSGQRAELAAALRADADAADARAEESFQRSDTDGFLSQWANNMSARLARKQADIIENGGVADFTGLFRTTGERIRAKRRSGEFGDYWMVLDADNKPTGVFFPCGARSRKQKKAGLCEQWELAPAWAKISGNGTGLSGCASAYVDVYRTDEGYPADAVDF